MKSNYCIKMVFCYRNCSDLLWEKNCSREFAKIFRSQDHKNNLFKQWKFRTIFGNRMLFLTCSWTFLISNKLEGGPQNLRQLNCSFTTISSHFLAIYINIFHENEVQTVILRCWAGLYLDWFMNYDTKCKYFHFQFFAILYNKTKCQSKTVGR